jgi:phenylalanyl-tRNA synthetase beta chain
LLPEVPAIDKPYVQLANPIASDRNVMRENLLSSVLEVVERNARIRPRQALFEIGPVFLAAEEGPLPDETLHLVIVMTGPRTLTSWQGTDRTPVDFYDLKGLLDALFQGIHVEKIFYQPSDFPSFHPGKSAHILVGEQQAGVMGELHPLVRERYELPETALLAADLDLKTLLEAMPEVYEVPPVSVFPPVLEDLAVIVDDGLPAERVEATIWQAGGKMLSEVRLFDVYCGEQIEAGKKSLAYSLTYQAPDRTLTDEETLKIRQSIVRQLEKELNARLRT